MAFSALPKDYNALSSPYFDNLFNTIGISISSQQVREKVSSLQQSYKPVKCSTVQTFDEISESKVFKV